MRPILIVKAGTKLAGAESRPGDFEDWIGEGLGVSKDRVRVARIYAGEALPAPDSVAAVLVTGSASMVSSREPWSERTTGWLREAVEAETPLLGICYGHQLLAHALGGEVGPNPRGREIGSVEVELAEAARHDPLFGGFGPTLAVHATHVESVLRLPLAAHALASSALDPHQVFAIGRRAWGVQFHPEFDADTMRGYLAGRRAMVRRDGLDPEALSRSVRDSDDGTVLLRRFAELALG